MAVAVTPPPHPHPSSPDVVVIGPATWNEVVHLDELPAPRPHAAYARSHVETVGGTSAGKALHLRELGRSTLLHTVVGGDAQGRLVRDALERAGVVVHAQQCDTPTERHLNLMDPYGGRVSLFLEQPAAPSGPLPGDVLEAMLSARAIVLDLSGIGGHAIPAAVATGVPIWTDLHDYDGAAAFHRPFLRAARFVFLNADGLTRPLDFLHDTVSAGAVVAVCTLGAEGAVAVDGHHVVHRVPAAPVAAVVDTNGAGDAFFAGFLGATLDGAPVATALAAGARQAATALGSVHLSPLLDR